ncbi:MAG: DNA methyltransferase [Ignavibacteriota bacterium]
MPGESVDLCYIDPPFHSRRDYGTREAPLRFFRHVDMGCRRTVRLRWITRRAGKSGAPDRRPGAGNWAGSLLAYLVSVAQRVIEIHRALRPTGSLFLHCDPSASHYLKLLLDAVFCAPGGFRNEIVWCYSHGGRSRRWFGRKHDIIFFYAKSNACYFDPRAVRCEMRSGTESFGGRLVTGEDGRK